MLNANTPINLVAANKNTNYLEFMKCHALSQNKNQNLQKEESNRVDYQFESCGEWNNDFVALNGGGENEADVRIQANQVLDDVNRNVVMI